MRIIFRSLVLMSTLFIHTATATVLGDMQTFAPNSDGLDFITLHTSRPLTKGFFALGGHLSFAKNHLIVFKDFETQDKYKYSDQLAEFDLDVAYALTDQVSVFFAAPNLIYQEPKSGQDASVYISKGVHSYRPGVKWTFPSFYDIAFIGSIDILNVTNSPYTGVEDNPIFNFEFAKTWRRPGQKAYGINVGYRQRNPSERPDDAFMFPLDDQYTFSLGHSAPFIWEKSRWVLEGIFSLPADQHPYKETLDASSADILIGFKHRWIRNLNFDWGFSVEPIIQTQAPQWRVFAGLVYYLNPGWTSNKEIEKVPPPAPEKEETYERSGDQSALFSDLQVTPEFAEVFEGTTVRMKASGGVGPYIYRIVRGRGHLNQAKEFYRAPLFPETATIEVSDSREQTKRVEIVVQTPPEPHETIRIKNLNFVFDTAILVPKSKTEIRRIVGIFNEKSVSRVIVEGHTDSKGSNEYNLELSERRADAIAKMLIEGLGIGENMVHAIGLGEERPIASNATEKGRLTNRRVVLKVYYKK